MPIVSSNPIVIEGVEYPYFLINLAISPYDAPRGASVALRLTPYRELGNDGQIEIIPNHAKALSLLDVFKVAENDPDFEAAVEEIMAALQKFITAKAL